MTREELNAFIDARTNAFNFYASECRMCITKSWRDEFTGYAVAYPMARGRQLEIEDAFLTSLLRGMRRGGMLVLTNSATGDAPEDRIMYALRAYRKAFLEWEAASAEFHGLPLNRENIQ